MKNRLQQVFSHTQPESYLGQMKFNNTEFSKEFQEKLEKMYKTGDPQKIDGVDSIELNQIINGETYPLDSQQSIVNVYIAPQKEPVKIEVETQFGKFTWDFYRTVLDEKIIVKTLKKSIVDIKFEFLKTNIVNFTVKSNPQCASSIIEIIHTYSAVLALFERLFNESPSQLSDIISSFQNELKFWQRAHQIEEVLNISFELNLVDAKRLTEDMQEVDGLYLLLVEKLVLRENKGFSSFTVSSLLKKGDVPIANINDKFALSFNSKDEINIWGVKICIHSICVAFNHIIDSIKENKEVTVFLREDESNPRYISFKGFISEKEQEEESIKLNENFSQNIKPYENAKTFEELSIEKALYW